MHVLLVIDSLASGGAQRQLTELAIGLQAIPGVRTTVLVYYEADFFGARLREAGRVMCYKLPLRFEGHPVDA